jgi:hypothetical protein
MSKDNSYLPAALKHDGRLIDSAIGGHKCKRPNALKHGLYSGAPLIPGEDPREFNKLYADLIKEWKPSGPTLRFALRRLADSMWQMERQKKFTQTQLSLTRFDPQSPAFDEVCGFAMFIRYLRSEPERSFEDQAKKYLRPDKINYLREKFPRSNYQSASEWAKALTSEILLVPLPNTPGFEPPEPETDFLKELAHQWKTEQMVAGCMIYASEILEYDFKQTERLNAMIVKQTRHCAELKAWEEAEKARSKT